MTDHEAVVDSILRRGQSAAEVLKELLEMAEGGKLDLKSFRTQRATQHVSGNLPAQYVSAGPKEIHLVLTLLDSDLDSLRRDTK